MEEPTPAPQQSSGGCENSCCTVTSWNKPRTSSTLWWEPTVLCKNPTSRTSHICKQLWKKPSDFTRLLLCLFPGNPSVHQTTSLATNFRPTPTSFWTSMPFTGTQTFMRIPTRSTRTGFLGTIIQTWTQHQGTTRMSSSRSVLAGACAQRSCLATHWCRCLWHTFCTALTGIYPWDVMPPVQIGGRRALDSPCALKFLFM